MKVVRPPYLPSNVVTKKLFRFFRIRVYEADEKLTVGYRNLVCDLTQKSSSSKTRPYRVCKEYFISKCNRVGLKFYWAFGPI